MKQASGGGGGSLKKVKRATRIGVGRGSAEGYASTRPKARPNQYQGFDAGKFLGETVDNFHRGVGAVARGVGDAIGGATRSVPSTINAGRNALMGGQESVVKKAMNK